MRALGLDCILVVIIISTCGLALNGRCVDVDPRSVCCARLAVQVASFGEVRYLEKATKLTETLPGTYPNDRSSRITSVLYKLNLVWFSQRHGPIPDVEKVG